MVMSSMFLVSAVQYIPTSMKFGKGIQPNMPVVKSTTTNITITITTSGMPPSANPSVKKHNCTKIEKDSLSENSPTAGQSITAVVTPQAIQLPEQVAGVESGLRNTLHVVPDLDGEIYLKRTTDRHDVNEDGIVNILDLVAVANAFGKNAPDVNGDGTVNVLDLVAVANAFESP